MRLKLFVALVFVALFASVHAGDDTVRLGLPRIFSDHMVLQRESSVRVWGWSEPGAEVFVTSSWGSAASTVADDDGDWAAHLETGAASFEKESVTVTSGTTAIRVDDVAIGEVWLAAGQSNMQMPLRNSTAGETSIRNSDNASIRLLHITPQGALDPVRDFDSGWAVSSPQTAAHFSAVAYYFADRLQKTLNVPVGIINASWGASTIGAWIDEPTLSRLDFVTLPEALDVKFVQKQPATAFNAMINPIVGYAIKGVIWYQGEAHVHTAKDEYALLLAELVRSWRELWNNAALPFYYAQIAAFDYTRTGRTNRGAAEIREIQRQFTNQVPNTGMVVTLDVSDCDDIHPGEKAPVGQRLANLALAETYSKPQGAHRSASVERIEARAGSLRIVFAESHGRMFGELQGFEVAGSTDSKFVPAQARFDGDHAVVVSSSTVRHPARVRYAAGETCPVATLFDGDGYPVGPFTLEAPHASPGEQGKAR